MCTACRGGGRRFGRRFNVAKSEKSSVEADSDCLGVGRTDGWMDGTSVVGREEWERGRNSQQKMRLCVIVIDVDVDDDSSH